MAAKITLVAILIFSMVIPFLRAYLCSIRYRGIRSRGMEIHGGSTVNRTFLYRCRCSSCECGIRSNRSTERGFKYYG